MPTNFLLITADDMNWHSPGCFGGGADDPTPNLRALAASGLRFDRAHVTIAVCQPSRSVLMTGRYPHRNGAEGFEPIDPTVPTLTAVLAEAGYVCGILGKVTHLAPEAQFTWAMARDFDELGCGRDPARYGRYARAFIEEARAAGRPFFLMANSHDPHRPFHGSEQERRKFGDRRGEYPAPSRVYAPDEVRVPGFLPDLPDVRREVAEYESSCRRCDDTVGAILKALADAGAADDTVVMFLSDNGMAFPFAKTNCYLNSTRTPWIVRWPGRIAPDTVEEDAFISGVDLAPTVLEVAGVAAPEGMDGASFLPLLRGRPQAGRERVVTVFHETAARRRYEMRCVQDARWGYIWNAWSDGEARFRNESQSGLTFAAMERAAEADAEVARRVRTFLYRTPEELYDFRRDPDALTNLADAAAMRETLDAMRRALGAWMERTGDPMRDAFRERVMTQIETGDDA